jgi:hypothetical protein
MVLFGLGMDWLLMLTFFRIIWFLATVVATTPDLFPMGEHTVFHPPPIFFGFVWLSNQFDEILSMGGHECILTHTKVSRCTMWRRVGVLVEIHREPDPRFPLSNCFYICLGCLCLLTVFLSCIRCSSGSAVPRF